MKKAVVLARFAPIFVGGGMLIASVSSANAQKPERRQEVRVPGIDIALKAGWRLLLQSGCRFAVPGSWQTTADGSGAFSRDGNNLSVRMLTIRSWPAHKAQIKAAFGHVSALHEDSDRRLWFEFGDTQRIEHYIDVVHGPTVCAGLLEIRAASTLTVDDANRIADSIGPAPAQWPPNPP
jgi:hypothetical protein